MRRKVPHVAAVLILALLAGPFWPVRSFAGHPAKADETEAEAKLTDRFSWDLRVLSYGILQGIANSTQNPANKFLQLPGHTGTLEVRPDLRLNLDPVELSAKPRLTLNWSEWREGTRKGDSQWQDSEYVNEWLARWKAREDLFVSYGRENLQWGPSFLFSPSNPFFGENGRQNPYLEVPGMDFGRLVWIPESSWTISFIANTDEGRNKLPPGPGPFEKAYAVKVDYTARESYASVILTHREDQRDTLGFFAGWTVSDAVLLYTEGALIRNNPALYPVNDASPFGISMVRDDTNLKPAVLIGGSYTLPQSGTVSLEYAYYGPGYDGDRAERYFALRQKGGAAFTQTGPLFALGQKTLGDTLNTGLRFLRRNYTLLQYNQNNLMNAVDLTLRWTQNLDDGSGQTASVVAYSFATHWELFSVGVLGFGGGDIEFGSILDWQVMAGVKYTF